MRTKNNLRLIGVTGVGKKAIAEGLAQRITNGDVLETVEGKREQQRVQLVAEGAIDAANILKLALVRGELQCIGVITLDEYRKHIEKDPALERQFRPIKVPKPTTDETIQILKELHEIYEIHHKLRYTDDALVATTQLAHLYIRNCKSGISAFTMLGDAKVDENGNFHDKKDCTTMHLDKDAKAGIFCLANVEVIFQLSNLANTEIF